MAVQKLMRIAIDLKNLWPYEDTPKFEINTNLLIGFNDRYNAYARTELINFEDEIEKESLS